MSSEEPTGTLGLWSGIGLVAANMIGAGVFLSAGFMAQEMSAGWILLDWVAGMVLAMAGARAYGEVARLVPRSGGEYRYLSELIHPSLGYLAGWASLLIGFAAPIAINALGAARFLGTVVPVEYPRVVATVFILVLTAFHSYRLDSSRWTQNALIGLKILLLLAFVGMGLALGSSSWPEWTPPSGARGFEAGPFFGNMFWIAFAFSGWNAAIYAAGEFRNPARDVPRAMIIGCFAVGTLYLLINWVFVANLTPADAIVVAESGPVLGHVVAQGLIGPVGAKLMSVFIALAFLSAMSAMILVGPRVYAAMAADGFLPKILVARRGRPPAGAALFQAAVSLTFVWTHSVRNALDSVGALLIIFSALTCLSLFALLRHRTLPRPRPMALVSAGAYVALSGWILYYGIKHRISSTVLYGAGAVMVGALVAYVVTERLRRRAAR